MSAHQLPGLAYNASESLAAQFGTWKRMNAEYRAEKLGVSLLEYYEHSTRDGIFCRSAIIRQMLEQVPMLRAAWDLLPAYAHLSAYDVEHHPKLAAYSWLLALKEAGLLTCVEFWKYEAQFHCDLAK